jgi:hypothetical protein
MTLEGFSFFQMHQQRLWRVNFDDDAMQPYKHTSDSATDGEGPILSFETTKCRRVTRLAEIRQFDFQSCNGFLVIFCPPFFLIVSNSSNCFF